MVDFIIDNIYVKFIDRHLGTKKLIHIHSMLTWRPPGSNRKFIYVKYTLFVNDTVEAAFVFQRKNTYRQITD